MSDGSRTKRYEEKHEIEIKDLMDIAHKDKAIKNYLNKLPESKKKLYKDLSKEELREVFSGKLDNFKKEAWKEEKEIFDFAVSLNKAIANKGLTLTQIATDLGLKQSSLTNYTSGTAEAGISTLVKLAEYLEVSSDYLLGRAEINKSEKAKLTSMDYMGLSAEAVEKLCENKNNPEHPLYAMLASYLIGKGYFDDIVYLLEKTLLQYEQAKLLYIENEKQQQDFLENQEYLYTKQLSKIFVDITSATNNIRNIAAKNASNDLKALEATAIETLYRMNNLLNLIGTFERNKNQEE